MKPPDPKPCVGRENPLLFDAVILGNNDKISFCGAKQAHTMEPVNGQVR